VLRKEQGEEQTGERGIRKRVHDAQVRELKIEKNNAV
jgi:hypothetical protein